MGIRVEIHSDWGSRGENFCLPFAVPDKDQVPHGRRLADAYDALLGAVDVPQLRAEIEQAWKACDTRNVSTLRSSRFFKAMIAGYSEICDELEDRRLYKEAVCLQVKPKLQALVKLLKLLEAGYKPDDILETLAVGPHAVSLPAEVMRELRSKLEELEVAEKRRIEAARVRAQAAFDAIIHPFMEEAERRMKSGILVAITPHAEPLASKYGWRTTRRGNDTLFTHGEGPNKEEVTLPNLPS